MYKKEYSGNINLDSFRKMHIKNSVDWFKKFRRKEYEECIALNKLRRAKGLNKFGVMTEDPSGKIKWDDDLPQLRASISIPRELSDLLEKGAPGWMNNDEEWKWFLREYKEFHLAEKVL